jgi:hypothetical protein
VQQLWPAEDRQQAIPQQLARALVTDPVYLKNLIQRLRRGQARHIERYFWMAAATKQKDGVTPARRIIVTCPLMRAGFPDGRTCEDCICGAKLPPARDRQPPEAPKRAVLPRQGLDFIRAGIQDPHYRVRTLRQLRSGRLPRNLERYLWQLAFGKLDEMEARLQPRDFHIRLPNEVKDPLKRTRSAPPAPPVQNAAASQEHSPALPRSFRSGISESKRELVISLPKEGSVTGEMEDFVMVDDPQEVDGPLCEMCLGGRWVRNDRGNDVELCQHCAGRGRRHRFEDS